MRLFTSEDDVLEHAENIRRVAYWAEIRRIAAHDPREFGALIYASRYYASLKLNLDVLRFTHGARWHRQMSQHRHAGESLRKFVYLSMLVDCRKVCA